MSIYLDWNATTPPAPEVLEAMRAASANAWGNPASVHGPGRAARAWVERARAAVGALLGLDPRDVVLTSGGTEANNLALQSVFASPEPLGLPALVVGGVEHPSVIRFAEVLAARGAQVVLVAPTPEGSVSVEAVSEALDRCEGRARLVSVQAVNHETGVIQPISGIAEAAHARGALLHCDAVQAVGKLEASAWADADLISIAGHKIRGPKGIGALATRCGLRLAPILRGGAQERGIRPGTQDPVASAGFAVALERARSTPSAYVEISALRDRLEERMLSWGASRNGGGPRAPHVANVSVPGWLGPELCAALDLEGVATSSGSACSAGTADPSPVIEAMVGIERARSAIRFSLGETSRSEDVDAALEVIRRVLAR